MREPGGERAEFAAGLDTGWLHEVADGAMEYLTRQARHGCLRPACRDGS